MSDRGKKKASKKSKDSDDETEDEDDSEDEDLSGSEEEASDETDNETNGSETDDDETNDETNDEIDNIGRAPTKIPRAKKMTTSVSFHFIVLPVLTHHDSTLSYQIQVMITPRKSKGEKKRKRSNDESDEDDDILPTPVIKSHPTLKIGPLRKKTKSTGDQSQAPTAVHFTLFESLVLTYSILTRSRLLLARLKGRSLMTDQMKMMTLRRHQSSRVTPP